ncbi:glycosyltransferase family 4 protein [Haloechinothrix salitolerans]|uniref:Glycosyltransferase family 4 protein n=1 Tax=Haloechinothrix salitolerans TaxID=926830 RepID=A0ABW2BTG6_9PSEU
MPRTTTEHRDNRILPLREVRVAMLNWRDREHSQGGGAEEYAMRVAHALVEAGARVTFVTARDRGQSRRGRDGEVRIVRLGGRLTVYPLTLAWLARHRNSIDVVIDCHNGIPFFSPLVTSAHTKTVLLIHHVHAEQFAVHYSPLLARFGAWLEGPVARWLYRKAITVTVSPSTVRAMRSRLGWRGPIFVVANGMTSPPQVPATRTEEPTLVCLGRLVTHKRVEQLIDPVLRLRQRWPGLRLHLIGSGPLEHSLRAATADLDGAIMVHGYVDDATKSRLLNQAWLHVTLSDGEGWGLAVLEAAAHGVPTVCRDVDGLCDSVRHGETGWRMQPDDDVVATLDQYLGKIADPPSANDVAEACRNWASRFDWTSTGERFVGVVANLLHGEAAAGWHRGQHEAIVAEFRLPCDHQWLKWAVARIGVGTRFGTDGDHGWVIAEQYPAGDLVTALHEAGATEVAVRAADDVERLLGEAVPQREHIRPRPRLSR